ncbi:MAG TPA: hypothetical protein VIX82_13975 [Solirubrobacteraceae bacterium]
MPDRNDTEELREAQRVREEAEEKLARLALDEGEAAQHKRRAEKSRYLRNKLEERAASERDED